MGSNSGEMQVALDDGSMVDILAEGGPNTFLRGITTSNMNHFSLTVDQIKEIQRKKKKRLNDYDKQKIISLHNFFFHLGTFSDLGLFREKVPESEIQCWLQYTIAEIKRFTTMRKWISTGNLEKQDTYILTNCIALFNQAIAVVLAFESEFFQALGDLVKARKGNGARPMMPTDEISEWIALIVCNGYYTTLSKFDNNWPVERGFKKLDESGLLEGFLRCATVPSSCRGAQAEQNAELLKRTFDELQGCPTILKKRFRPDDTCGKVVRAILEGKDGSRTPRQDIIRRLQEIATCVDSIETASKGGHTPTLIRSCRKCGQNDTSDAFQQSLMRCGRCQKEFYCSKDCQRADWKDHKKFCTPATKSTDKQLDVFRQTVQKIIQDQYVDIMVRMVEECNLTNSPKKDLVVTLDFRVNQDGIVPAMQDPPIFGVVPTCVYLDGSWDSEPPDWVSTDEDMKKHLKNIESRTRTINDQYSRMTPRHALFFVTYKGGYFCSKIEYGNMYSDEAFEAFRSAVIDDDHRLLFRALDNEQAALACTDLAMKYGILRSLFPDMTDAVLDALQDA